MADRPVDEVERGLVRRLSSRHPAVYEPALAELLRRHGPSVVSFVERRVADFSVVRAVVEEVFLTLALRPHSFDDSRYSLRSYLVADAYRHCIRALQGADAERAHSTAGSRPDEQVRDELLLAEERLAMDLALFGEMTYRDIAALLDCPTETVLDRLTSALQRLSTTSETHVDDQRS